MEQLTYRWNCKPDEQRMSQRVGGIGTCAFMPRDLPHAWKSTGHEPGRILFLYTPAKAGGAFEEAVRMNRPISSMSQQEAAERRQRHGSETVGPPPF